MTLLTVVIVLLSALLHASWNLVVKKAGRGPEFVWLFSVIAVALFAPAAFGTALKMELPGLPTLGIIAASAICEVGYYLALQGAYLKADLSIVYPIARGFGPLLTVFLAGPLLGEKIGFKVLAGTAWILGGSLFLVSRRNKPGNSPEKRGVLLGVVAGFFIAGYTLIDKVAVSLYSLPAIFYFWAVLFLQVLFLTPIAIKRREALKEDWLHFRREAFLVAILCSLAYTMILWVLTFSPVSRIAPCREVGIVFGTYLGSRFLGEPEFRGRLFASAAVFIGVLLLVSA